jgi:hypothetical protein
MLGPLTVIMYSATFGLYLSYVAGILNSVKPTHFCVLCNKQIMLNILKNLLREKSALLSCLQNNFKLVRKINFQLSLVVRVEISFEAILMHGQLPVELIFAQSVKRNTFIVSSLRCCVHQETFDIYHK